MQRLTVHFSLEELYSTSHRGVDNRPPAAAIARLEVTACGLEAVRMVLGRPIIVLSGYRCPELNCIVGGAMTRATLQQIIDDGLWLNGAVDVARRRLQAGQAQEDDSQHMMGEAVDFIAPAYGSPFQICQALEARMLARDRPAEQLEIDQLILESTWVHISFVSDRAPRGEILTARKGGYTPGLVRLT